MSSSSCEADVHNWDDRKDDLSGALDHAEKAALTGRNGSEHEKIEKANEMPSNDYRQWWQSEMAKFDEIFAGLVWCVFPFGHGHFGKACPMTVVLSYEEPS